MPKLPIPLICDCGFSTMDAKAAYDHAMKHQADVSPEPNPQSWISDKDRWKEMNREARQ
jgi:hypothetical protein